MVKCAKVCKIMVNAWYLCKGEYLWMLGGGEEILNTYLPESKPSANPSGCNLPSTLTARSKVIRQGVSEGIRETLTYSERRFTPSAASS